MPATGATHFWMDHRAPVEALRFRRAPLLAAAIAFASGEFLALHWQFAAFLTATSFLLTALTLLALRKSLRISTVPLLALWVVAGCWCVQMQPAAPRQTALLAYADGLSRTVRGRVVRVRNLTAHPPASNSEQEQPWKLEPGQWASEGKQATQSIDLAVDQVEFVTPDTSEMRLVTGGVRVTILDGALPLTCGDTLEMPLRLREPERYRDPGAWSYADQLLSEGIDAQANVKAASIVHPPQLSAGRLLNPKPWTLSPLHLHCRLYAAQAWASARMSALITSHANHILPTAARLTPDDAAMLNAMLFGDRTGLRRDLRLGFERTGSFHLFVVSGMHVALLAGLLFWALRKLRAPHGLATILTIAATAAYAALTGFGVPVQRALLMATIFLIARWLWRDVSILQAIGAAALTVLIFDPRALTEVSFQMTFLALIAVGGIAIPLAERGLLPRLRATRDLDAKWLDARLPPHLAQMRLMLRLFGGPLAGTIQVPQVRSFGNGFAQRQLRNLPAFTLRILLRIAELTLVGIVVEACMSLPMAIYFHRATPFALPANLLAVPLVAILAPLAVLTFCSSLVSSWLATIPAAATAIALHGVRHVIQILSHARLADTRVPAPTTLATVIAIAALAVTCYAVRRRSRWLLASGIATLAMIPLTALWPSGPIIHPGTLEVTALDVGQGDSLLVISPEGRTLLVDAGGPIGQPANAEKWDVGEEVVAPYLWSRHVRRLDAVLLTHAHSDHMGGMPAILRDFRPRELWVSIDPANSPDYRALLALAAQLNIDVRHYAATDLFPWGGLTVTVLAPEPAYENPSAPRNDDSLVVRLDYGKSSVVLEGDAERPSEDTMLANQRIAPVTLLKVGHHGSRTSTNPEFLAAAAPQEAVISVGRRNTFGHPRFEVLERLEQAHIKTFRTDRAGATTFLLSAEGQVSTLSAAQ